LPHVPLLAQPFLRDQTTLEGQLILVIRLLRAFLVDQHFRPCHPFRRLLPLLGDLRAPLARVALVIRPAPDGQESPLAQLILLFRLLPALLLGQHLRPFRHFRPLLTVLGHLRAPLARVALLVRPVLVCPGALEAQLVLLFRLFQVVLLGQLLRPLLPFPRVLTILWNQRVPLPRVPLLVRPLLLDQGALEAQLILRFRLFPALLMGQLLRPFLPFRPLLPILWDLRVPLPRVVLLVRPVLLAQ